MRVDSASPVWSLGVFLGIPGPRDLGQEENRAKVRWGRGLRGLWPLAFFIQLQMIKNKKTTTTSRLRLENLQPGRGSGMPGGGWEAGAWGPGPSATASPQTLRSPKPQDPRAVLNPFLPSALTGDLLLIPQPFQPLFWTPGFLRLVTQQQKVKVPRGCHSHSRSGAAFRGGRRTHLNRPLSFLHLPSPSAWHPGRSLSFQTRRCPSGVRRPVPPAIGVCCTQIPHPRPPAPCISAPWLQEGQPPPQVELDRCVLTLHHPLWGPRAQDQH